MNVREFCMSKTNVHELVVIREGGYIVATAYIDHEDLFRLPGEIARSEVSGCVRDLLSVNDSIGHTFCVPCVYLDLAQ